MPVQVDQAVYEMLWAGRTASLMIRSSIPTRDFENVLEDALSFLELATPDGGPSSVIVRRMSPDQLWFSFDYKGNVDASERLIAVLVGRLTEYGVQAEFTVDSPVDTGRSNSSSEQLVLFPPHTAVRSDEFSGVLSAWTEQILNGLPQMGAVQASVDDFQNVVEMAPERCTAWLRDDVAASPVGSSSLKMSVGTTGLLVGRAGRHVAYLGTPTAQPDWHSSLTYLARLEPPPAAAYGYPTPRLGDCGSPRTSAVTRRHDFQVADRADEGLFDLPGLLVRPRKLRGNRAVLGGLLAVGYEEVGADSVALVRTDDGPVQATGNLEAWLI